jgi:hypothetical protein
MRDDRFFLETVDAKEGRFRIASSALASASAVMVFLIDDWKLVGNTAGVMIIISLWSSGSRGDEQPVRMEDGVNRAATVAPASSSSCPLQVEGLTEWFIASLSGEVGPSQMMLDESRATPTPLME